MSRSRWRISRRTSAWTPVRKTRPEPSSYLSSSETSRSATLVPAGVMVKLRRVRVFWTRNRPDRSRKRVDRKACGLDRFGADDTPRGGGPSTNAHWAGDASSARDGSNSLCYVAAGRPCAVPEVRERLPAGTRCGVARGHPAGYVPVGLARRPTRDGRHCHGHGARAARSLRHIVAMRVDADASRPAGQRGAPAGRLWRSRRKAGGAARESWVDDRSRTGTRATTRVRHRRPAGAPRCPAAGTKACAAGTKVCAAGTKVCAAGSEVCAAGTESPAAGGGSQRATGNSSSPVTTMQSRGIRSPAPAPRPAARRTARRRR